jgi:diguanylate cyclase (GGDEF)-like protein
VSNAAQLNPLTALPGNILIERKLSDALRTESTGCILYLDIDHFKAYNDVYGFENGDKVIKQLADIITHTISEPNFVGHVGGDDFMVLIRGEDLPNVEKSCRTILAEFELAVPKYYKKADRENGYIIAKSRSGFQEQFPLLSLSIAGVLLADKNFADVFEISEEVSRVKKECKQAPGNSFLIV